MSKDDARSRWAVTRRALWLGLLLVALAAGRPHGVVADGRGDPLASACGVQTRSYVAPAAVALGGQVTVLDDVVFSCPQRRRPLHVAIVAPWPPTAEVDQAVIDLGAALELDANTWVATGLVAYGDTSRTLCGVQPGESGWAECRAAGRTAGGALGDSRGLAAAIYQGWKALLLARQEPHLRQAEEPVREVLALLAPVGRPPAGVCAEARAELAAARGDGLDVSLLCPSGRCPSDCLGDGLGDSPLPPDRRPPAETLVSLTARLATLARASELRVAELTLRETVPVDFDVDEQSFDPPATSAIPGAFTWHLPVRASGEATIRFAARARKTGNLVVAEAAYLAFTDTVGRSGGTVLAPRRVSVGWRALLPVGLREGRDLDP